MKCEHCGRNEATFHYQRTVNGQTEEAHLCPACAAELGYDAGFGGGFESMFDDTFGSVFSLLPSMFGNFSGFFDGPQLTPAEYLQYSFLCHGIPHLYESWIKGEYHGLTSEEAAKAIYDILPEPIRGNLWEF